MWNAGRTATPYISVVCHVVKKRRTAGWLLFLLVVCQQLNAQHGAVNLHVKIRVPAGDTRFDSLLHLITRQTGVKFSVNTRKYPLSRTIRIGKSTLSLGDLLAVIHEKSGIYYTALGTHIIFVDHPPKQVNTIDRLSTSPLSPVKTRAPIVNTPKHPTKTVQLPAAQTGGRPSGIILEQLPIPAPTAPVVSIVISIPTTSVVGIMPENHHQIDESGVNIMTEN